MVTNGWCSFHSIPSRNWNELLFCSENLILLHRSLLPCTCSVPKRMFWYRNTTFHMKKKALLFQTSKKPELSCGGNSFQYYCFIKYIDFRAPISSKENTSWDLVQLLSSPMPLAECVTFVHSTHWGKERKRKYTAINI